jgi:predicted Zn-dependent protease
MTIYQCSGGFFHPQLPIRRAQATCNFDDLELVFKTEYGSFSLDYDDALLRVGGSTGKMIFIENETKEICFFCEDPRFVQQIQRSDLQKKYQICIQTNRKERYTSGFLWVCVFVFGISILSVLYTLIPQIAIASLDSIPIVVDEKIGTLSASQMDHGGVEIHDANVVEPIKKIVHQLASVAQSDGSTTDTFDFDIHVIRSDIENAYALPSGYIVIYTGLIESSSSPEQIAGVLAHEMAHVTERHGLIKVMETAGVSSLVTLLIGDVEGVISLGAQLLSYSTVNAYSRQSETEADEIGFETMYKANINPQGMIDFFATLEASDDVEDEIIKNMPTWIQSHPKHQERIKHLQQIQKSYPSKEYTPLDINFEALQNAIQSK